VNARVSQFWASLSPQEKAAWLASVGKAPVSVEPAGRVLASGNARVQVGSVTPQKAALLQWAAPDGQCVPCFLSVGPLVLNGTGDTPEFIQGWQAALNGFLNGATQTYFQRYLQLEYGVGGALSNVVEMDLRSGYIALPPVSYVRLAYVDEGVAAGAPLIAAGFTGSAALVAGSHPQADVPTFTMSGIYDGAYPFPLQAKAVELVNPGRLSWPTGGAPYTGRVIQETTAATPLVSPPWAPVRVPGATNRNVLTFDYVSEPVAGLRGLLVFSLDL
jgi:hypothetical protein